MDKKLLARRIAAIRRQFSKNNIDGLLLTKPANVSFTTGFLGDDSWAFIGRTQVYLLTDSRYTEQAQGECPYCRIIERTEPLAQAMATLIEKCGFGGALGVEKTASLADMDTLKKHVRTTIRAIANVTESVRCIKQPWEVDMIRTAAAIAARAMRQTTGQIKPGVTESELAGLLDLEIRRLGTKAAFETIVAFGPNASRPHHQPGKRRLKSNDTVLIDFGARCNGYCSDITRCFIVGKPRPLFVRVFETLERAQAAAIAVVRAGATITEVDNAARQIIGSANLPVYGHGTGHGLGLEIHEDPYLKPEIKGTLQAGQVITIEPGIYMPGKLGVRIEDDVLVTEKGCEILTRRCPHSPRLPA